MSALAPLRRVCLLLTLLRFALPCAAWALGNPTPPDLCQPPALDIPAGPNGVVLAMVRARGDLYIGGSFTAVGGVAARNVARWDGHRWHSLGTGDENGVGQPYRYTNYGRERLTTPSVQALAVAPNGDVYVGGEFAQAGHLAAAGLARWDGHHWGAVGDFRHLEEDLIAAREAQARHSWQVYLSRFNTPPPGQHYLSTVPQNCQVLALAVAADGTLYAGGSFQYAASAYPADTTVSGVARWDGHVWTVPGQGVPGTVHALVAAPDGRVYAGGDLWSGEPAEPDIRGRVACWQGTAWSTIGTSQNNNGAEVGAGMPSVVHALALLPNGTLYAAGSGESSPVTPGDTDDTVARWDGHAWSACGPGGLQSFVTIYALAATADGQVYAAGQLADSVGARLRLLRWNGRRWRRLGRAQPDSATCTVRALAVLPTGEVYVGGQFAEDPQLPGTHFLARWKARRWAYLREAGEPATLIELRER
jgi:hypothetical protein